MSAALSARSVRADLADDVSYIAAHEPDPRKEEVLYEAAEALERYAISGGSAQQLSVSAADRLTVVFVCGEPTIFIGGKQIAKFGCLTDEGKTVAAWAKARWNAERGEGVEGALSA